MEAINKETYISSKGYMLRRLFRILVALASIILLAVLAWQAYSIYQLSVDKIYNQSYVPYTLQVEEQVGDSAVTPIEYLYLRKEYKAVLPETKLVTSVTERDKLLVGIACMETQNYLPAISWLNRVTTEGGKTYMPTAQYYLALTHIINEDFDRAIELMQLIVADTSHPYHSRFNEKMIQQMRLLKWK